MPATDITGPLASYMAEAWQRALPPQVAKEGKHRILDSLAAMVSGAHLKPGEMAIRFARAQGGTAEASILTTDIQTTAINAALVNGMFGHADETDDFEPVTKAHPGCSVVPAALAMAEREGRSGTELLNGVALGYDLCCRLLLALGPDLVRGSHRSAEGTSSTFGAVDRAINTLCSPSSTSHTPLKPICAMTAAVTPLRAPMPEKSKAFSTCSASRTQLHTPDTCWAA